MFIHIFKYRLLSYLNSRLDTFWTIFFPIILATCFALAFGNISKKEYVFHSVPVAVVYEEENELFKTAINIASSNTSEGENFLKLTETDSVSALKLLEDGKVDAVIFVNESIEMTVKNSGLNQTAIQCFINTYLQKESIYKTLVKDGNLSSLELLSEINNDVNYIEEKNLTKDNPDSMLSYYFSLIAMAILFGGYFGSKCGREMNANITSKGIRKCISPINKSKLILAEFFATILIHAFSLLLLLLYMLFILKLNLGNQFGYIALTCLMGSLCGVAGGIFIGSLPISENAQGAIVTLTSLASSFLSGLMINTIKIFIEKNLPILNRVNPATVIQDSLYSLLIYDTHDRYFQNMIILFVYAVVMCVASFIITRRTRYANI